MSEGFLRNRIKKLAAQQSDMSKYKHGFDAYGYFEKPSDFTPTIPCLFYRDALGVVRHTMPFSVFKNGAVIEINTDTGSDTGDGSAGVPYKSFGKCFDVINASGGTAFIIKVQNNFVSRSQATTTKTVTGKLVAIVPKTAGNRVMITTNEPGLVWTQDGLNTYKATRASVYAVFDKNRTDSYGVPIPYTHKTSLISCQAEAYSWYTDDTYVWVNTGTASAPDSNFIIGVSMTLFNITLLSNAVLYMENLDFVSGRNANLVNIYGDNSGATVTGKLVVNNCKFVGGYLRSTGVIDGNALATLNVKEVYIFDSLAAYSARDGFNHHFTNVPDANKRECFVLEYNVGGYDVGRFGTIENNNNVSTCHDGVYVLRVRPWGEKSQGPICADVNGCYSIIIDGNMKNSLATADDNFKSAYYFDNETPPSGVTGKAILINSQNNSDNGTYDLFTATGFDITLYASLKSNYRPSATPKVIT